MHASTTGLLYNHTHTQAESLKEKGNTLFSSKDYIAAHNNYSHDVHITTQLNAHCDNDPLLLSSQRILFVSALIGNNALVLYKLGRGRYSEMQVNYNSIDGYDLTKIWYRRALAFTGGSRQKITYTTIATTSRMKIFHVFWKQAQTHLTTQRFLCLKHLVPVLIIL